MEIWHDPLKSVRARPYYTRRLMFIGIFSYVSRWRFCFRFIRKIEFHVLNHARIQNIFIIEKCMVGRQNDWAKRNEKKIGRYGVRENTNIFHSQANAQLIRTPKWKKKKHTMRESAFFNCRLVLHNISFKWQCSIRYTSEFYMVDR